LVVDGKNVEMDDDVYSRGNNKIEKGSSDHENVKVGSGEKDKKN
jgi:hypothetical protein